MTEVAFRDPRAAAGDSVLVALSGGVDSSVAALRLLEAGYRVEAAYIRTWMHEDDPFAQCPAEEEIEEASAAAAALRIPFRVVNLVDAYRDRVVGYLVDGYRRGVTPNPDVMCNREIKFGMFADYGSGEGFDWIATGHYVRSRVREGSGELWVGEGLDPEKDQSYFLALSGGTALRRALFPLGELRKTQVRELAQRSGLPNARRKDSQGICFLGKVDLREFLRQYIPDRPGRILNRAGAVLGEHPGIHAYTIGQRRGLNIPSNKDHEFYVVVAKDVESGDLTVAFESDRESGLWSRRARVGPVSWIGEGKPEGIAAWEGRPRYRDPRQRIGVSWRPSGGAEIEFEETQRGLAAGQVLAFYDRDRLLGGAVFERVDDVLTVE